MSSKPLRRLHENQGLGLSWVESFFALGIYRRSLRFGQIFSARRKIPQGKVPQNQFGPERSNAGQEEWRFTHKKRALALGHQVNNPDTKETTTMQHFFYAFLIALTNNVDNVGARIAYSIRGIKISTPINLWVSVITFAISYLAAISGTMISDSVGKHFSSILALLIFVAIGVWMILEQYLKQRRNKNLEQNDDANILEILSNPEKADMDHSKHIDFKEATLLGIALSLNNVGGGLSAGMIGLNSFLVGILSAVLSFAALWAGNYVADFFVSRNISDRAAVVGGILMIAIGIGQVL